MTKIKESNLKPQWGKRGVSIPLKMVETTYQGKKYNNVKGSLELPNGDIMVFDLGQADDKAKDNKGNPIKFWLRTQLLSPENKKW